MSGAGGVFQVLVDAIARKTGADPASLGPRARLVDLGLDSIKVMELVVELEQAFDLAVDQEELAELATLGDVADHVERRLASR